MIESASDPFERFRELLERAQALELVEPTAMAVATATPDGRPSVRMLLLKGLDERGFVFYTNLQSRKAHELDANPSAALCFFWAPLAVQIRAEGRTEPVGDAEADAYFATRPRGSQIGAWASRQSAALVDRAELEAAIAEAAADFGDGPIPRPEFWSGYRLIPDRIEFWFGQADRLHDRELYTRVPGGWRVQRLYP